MKHLMFLPCMLAILVLSSCTKEADVLKLFEDTYSSVTFNFTGQELAISEIPLTKASDAKDWYAFQVYYRPAGSDTCYIPYAYGFFDNKTDMVINLKDGYEYQFDVNMTVEASKKVYYFCLTQAGWTQVQNKFLISSSETVRHMYEGYLYMLYPKREKYDRPMADRFMGRAEGYLPKDGGVVNIEMKRVAFGIQFVPKYFTSGKLELDIEGAGTLEMTAGVDSTKQEMISFASTGAAYESIMAGREYAESVPVNIVWVQDDSLKTRTPIANQAISFKRNMLTTVSFAVGEAVSSNTFNLVGNEALENGGTVVIGGDGTNTDVNIKE